MARRRGGFIPQAPKKVTLIIALILWLVGLLAGLGIVHLPAGFPSTTAFWSLVIAGALLILGSLFDGI
jgi:hypothetical protein